MDFTLKTTLADAEFPGSKSMPSQRLARCPLQSPRQVMIHVHLTRVLIEFRMDHTRSSLGWKIPRAILQ